MLTKIIKTVFSIVIIIIAVVFAVSNRGKIDITIFPLPYAMSMPLFLFAIIMFALGLLTAWFISRISLFGYRKLNKGFEKRIDALQNEISALRAEQLVGRKAISSQ